MIFSPLLALCLGWEAFFAVALTSISNCAVLFMGKSVSTHLIVGKLTSDLVQDLVFADKNRRHLVLGGLKEAEGNWFLAELPRAKAELRRNRERNNADCCNNVRWAWRIRFS